LIDMVDDEFCINAAAARFGAAPALIDGATVLSFAQCARQVAALPAHATVIGDISITSILAVYRGLQDHRPVGLVHPKLPLAETAKQQAALAAAQVRPGTAAIVFTSGSTGSPRGVVLSRQALAAAAQMSAAHLGWRDDDRWALPLSLAHVGGLNVVLRCLAAGKPVVLTPTLQRLALVLRNGEATLASVVPTQLQDLLNDPTWAVANSVRALLLGGAAAPAPLLAAAHLRRVPVLTTYGASETCGQVVTAPVDGHRVVGIGVPLPQVHLQVGTMAAPAPVIVQAPSLFDGYLDQAPTAARTEFVTSDLGYFASDGSLVIVGRSDDVIISGGENVHPATVEAVLLATPGVVAAVAFGVADLRWGVTIVAALVVTADFVPTAAYAQWHQALAPYQRPRHLALVAALPLTATGKVDRRAAAALPRQAIEY
jgi:O-succinylbenzoic acid--CoA ligase